MTAFTGAKGSLSRAAGYARRRNHVYTPQEQAQRDTDAQHNRQLILKLAGRC